MKDIKRGQIWLTDFSPSIGSEQAGVRPCVVLQNNLGNKFSPTVIVAVISSSTIKKQLPTHVALQAVKDGLERDSIIFLEQIRTIDKNRLGAYITTLDDEKMKQVDEALALSVGLCV